MHQYRRERLLELIKEKYQDERVRFCEAAALSDSRLSQILSPTYRGGTVFNEKTARKLEKQADLPALYFDQGAAPSAESPVVTEGGPFKNVQIFHDGNEDVILVPHVELIVRAGITGFTVDQAEDEMNAYPLEKRWVERNGFQQDQLIALKVKGESMFPLYKEGDVIVINTGDTKPTDGKEFVVNFEGDVVLKRLSRDAGSWWLTSENPEPRYHRRIVRSNETMIIGRVVKHDRTL